MHATHKVQQKYCCLIMSPPQKWVTALLLLQLAWLHHAGSFSFTPSLQPFPAGKPSGEKRKPPCWRNLLQRGGGVGVAGEFAVCHRHFSLVAMLAFFLTFSFISVVQGSFLMYTLTANLELRAPTALMVDLGVAGLFRCAGSGC